jgi:hypothetical protein
MLIAPVLWVFMGRVRPVTWRDLAALQLPLLAAAAAPWLATDGLLRDLAGLRGLPLMARSGVLSYGLSALVLATTRPGRMALAQLHGMARSIVGFAGQRLAH